MAFKLLNAPDGAATTKSYQVKTAQRKGFHLLPSAEEVSGAEATAEAFKQQTRQEVGLFPEAEDTATPVTEVPAPTVAAPEPEPEPVTLDNIDAVVDSKLAEMTGRLAAKTAPELSQLPKGDAELTADLKMQMPKEKLPEGTAEFIQRPEPAGFPAGVGGLLEDLPIGDVGCRAPRRKERSAPPKQRFKTPLLWLKKLA